MTSKALETQDLLLNMGPQHPSTHGVLRLVVRTDGEFVGEVTPVIGYLHRCAEKIGESVRYEQYLPYTDRLDYLAAMGNNLGYCLAVERLLGHEVPPRGQYIRVLMAELNRIASHLLALGAYGLDLGAFTPFLYGFRDREQVNDIFEKTCGTRLTMHYIIPGGLAEDVDEKFVQDTRAFCEYFKPLIEEYERLLSGNIIIQERTKGVEIGRAHV